MKGYYHEPLRRSIEEIEIKDEGMPTLYVSGQRRPVDSMRPPPPLSPPHDSDGLRRARRFPRGIDE